MHPERPSWMTYFILDEDPKRRVLVAANVRGDSCGRRVYDSEGFQPELPVPIGEGKMITELYERRGIHCGYVRASIDDPQHVVLVGGQEGFDLRSWRVDGEGPFERLGYALKDYAVRAKPTHTEAWIIVDGISGLSVRVDGWSVDVNGMARYAVKSPFAINERSIIGVEYDFTGRCVPYALLADGTRYPIQLFSFRVLN